MRVKIAYTVELEEVESEISDVMSRASEDLDYSYTELTRIQLDLQTKADNLSENIEKIDIIRRKMSKADAILQDCQSVLEGLLQVKTQLKEQENEIQDG